MSDPIRVGAQNEPKEGGSYTSELLQAAGPELTFTPTLEQMKGSLLLSGKAYYPTVSTAHRNDWHIPCAVTGIPASGPIRAEFDNLISELL